MNLVDSSGWIEYFFGGENASYFSPPIEAIDKLVDKRRKFLLVPGEFSIMHAVGAVGFFA